MTRAKNMNEISDETKSVIANDKVGQDQRSLGDLEQQKGSNNLSAVERVEKWNEAYRYGTKKQSVKGIFWVHLVSMAAFICHSFTGQKD